MASEQSSPARHVKLRTLEHIEIHEDVLLVTQHDRQPSTASLEAAFANLKLNGRIPLGELELKAAQYAEQDMQTKEEAGAETCSADSGAILSVKPSVYNSIASPSRTQQQLTPLQTTFSPPPGKQNIELLEKLSPANHKIRFDRAGEWIHSLKAARLQSKSHDANAGVHVAATPPTKYTRNSQEQTSAVARSSVHSQKRHMALTPTSRSSLSASLRLPDIEITKRQQGQGDNHTEAQKVKDATTFSPASLAVMSSPAVKRSVSNKENLEPLGTPLRSNSAYDILEAAVIDAATPPAQPQQLFAAQPPVEDVVAFGDVSREVMEDSEAVSPACTVVIGSAEEAVAQPAITETAVTGAMHNADATTQDTKVMQSKTKKTPVVRTTKAAQARIELAHGPKDAPRAPAWGRPRESIGRSNSLRRASGPRIASSGSGTSSDDEKKVNIPHSKPRPMSMIFPPPPPPPKSNKTPTRSTFALPGEAVAAKLKAARLEREKTDAGPKVFKARPVPAMIKHAPIVRQTNTSRARESIGGVATQPQLTQAHRRASSVAFARPAEKRQSMSVRPTSSDKSTAVVTNRPSSRDKPQTLRASRPSTALANISKPRSPVDAIRASLGRSDLAVKSAKGREVFARTGLANQVAEREKRAKEEATRKARAEAAERSRQLSREWAEKKRREKTEVKIEVTPA